jgi:superfamily I DNA/RNA helicase
MYRGEREGRLSFAMLNRLADWLLRHNQYVRRALHATYEFVFLDEFQDTTYPQLELIHSALDGSDAVFTAVGDDKQRIMGWAGAMPDAFAQFVRDFDAVQVSLVSNWRSHAELVRMQHVIAARIDPCVPEPQARAERTVAGEVAGIWEYATEAAQSRGIAGWVAGEVAMGIPPHEIAILVRSNQDVLESNISPEFSSRHLNIRNVARLVGDISIQDLLGEELTDILVPLIRLGATERDPDAWACSVRALELLGGVSQDDTDGQQRIQRRLETFVRAMRVAMNSMPPNEEAANAIAGRALEFVGADNLRRMFPVYRRMRDFNRVWEGFLILFVECSGGVATWGSVIDRFLGRGQVVLMTVHKSKGLEFHTMIFFGLDNQTWWSLTPNRTEELNSFFVAFTRARQRAFFTFCAERGRPVAWVENLLAPTGLRRLAGPE